MRFRRIREYTSRWLARCAPPSPVLRTYPGWRLGAGERRSGRISTALRRQLWYGVSTPVLTPWLDGLSVYAYPGNETSRAVFITGNYEPNEFCMLSQVLRPGMVFVDVGANMGLYTIFAARKVGEGTVLAIEPSTRECGRLLKNVEANSLSNVRLLQNAVSDSSRDADLLVAEDEWSGHNTLGAFAYDTPLAAKERVRTVRLDDIVLREGLSRVDIIKLDIEGAELLALKGAVGILERFRPLLLLELADGALLHQGCSSAQIWDFLRQTGYQIFSFDQQSGLPVPARQKPHHDSENVVAAPESYEQAAAWRVIPGTTIST
jgi:FkbM family methyltransferase